MKACIKIIGGTHMGLAILNFICAFCWFMTGIMNFHNDDKKLAMVNFTCSLLWLISGILNLLGSNVETNIK
ncbi:hypothetical protein [Thomasclavelia cocleata]|jgi:hypothetical protein|uniref:hypothetical protein n=1 Tax=Thomasclavelia cocleata TaxID=69824 RepID=UPI00256EA929|nr:hypothetical protein [Thomasclavelia cocleata]